MLRHATSSPRARPEPGPEIRTGVAPSEWQYPTEDGAALPAPTASARWRRQSDDRRAVERVSADGTGDALRFRQGRYCCHHRDSEAEAFEQGADGGVGAEDPGYDAK